MTVTISQMLKSTTHQILPAMMGTLTKAQEHAKATGVDESVFLASRLYPDMFPMGRQVQIATDMLSRGAARLAKVDFLSLPDVEVSFAELIGRAEKCRSFIGDLDDAALDASANREIEVPIGKDKTMTMKGSQYLLGFVFPNFYFHASTAYGLLRQSGVVLGKRDFIAPPQA